LIDDTKPSLNERKLMYERFIKYLDNKQNRNKFRIEELTKEEYLVVDSRQSDLRLYRNRVPTLRTGSHNLFYVKNGKFKKISGYEGLLLQGFSKQAAEKLKAKVPDKYLLNQVGNAMTVTVIKAIGRSLLNYIKDSK
jgi:DNA (cytosine-5)-methyltransferase 1